MVTTCNSMFTLDFHDCDHVILSADSSRWQSPKQLIFCQTFDIYFAFYWSVNQEIWVNAMNIKDMAIIKQELHTFMEQKTTVQLPENSSIEPWAMILYLKHQLSTSTRNHFWDVYRFKIYEI